MNSSEPDPCRTSLGTAEVWSWRTGATNLSYLLRPEGSRRVLAVDCPNGTELTHVLSARGWELAALFLTHTHHDHVHGLERVVNETGCALFTAESGSGRAASRVVDGMEWTVEGTRVVAWDTSGHSPMDVSYLFPEWGLCACGDTLFDHGCGRMFAGPAKTLWASLRRLRSLPADTLVACGHDFRADNADFLEGELADLERYAAAAKRLRQDLEARPDPALVRIGDQKHTNPFLRADDPVLARHLGRSGADPVDVFAELRKRRDRY